MRWGHPAFRTLWCYLRTRAGESKRSEELLRKLAWNDGKLRGALITTCRFLHREESYGRGERRAARSGGWKVSQCSSARGSVWRGGFDIKPVSQGGFSAPGKFRKKMSCLSER